MEDVVRNAQGSLGLFIPIDHSDVVRPRSSQHLYAAVEKRIEDDGRAISAWLEECGHFIEAPEFEQIRAEARDDRAPYWGNGYFAGDDARCLVAMLRHYNPRRYVEIGSGNSTRFARWAIDLWGLRSHVACIDPAPRAHVAHLADAIVEKSLLEVDPGVFAELEGGDILFHDGSHIAFNGTDTTALFLEVLPRIRPGVVFHIHDICLPWEYTEAFDNRGYNEQYLLAAMLLFGSGWEVLAPVTYLQRKGRLKHGGTSFWMRKR
jgi:hypothetical protein